MQREREGLFPGRCARDDRRSCVCVCVCEGGKEGGVDSQLGRVQFKRKEKKSINVNKIMAQQNQAN